MLEDVSGHRPRVRGPRDGDEVGDAEQRDDDQQGLCCLPVLVVVLLGRGRGAKFRDYNLRNRKGRFESLSEL